VRQVRHRTDPLHAGNYSVFIFWQEHDMKSPHTIAALIVAGTAFLTSCANTTSPPSDSGGSAYSTNVSSGYGTIASINVQTVSANTGAGAVVGGLVGALVGTQIGSGTGNTAATIAGAAGGALVGNKVEANRNPNGVDQYQINIKMDNGETRTVIQSSANGLSVGNRVRIVDGRIYPI
jgi:outer membrane lipoprotein SlyB